MVNRRVPRRLRDHDRHLQPSGAINLEALARAVSYFESIGHRVVVAPQVSSQWRYFASADRERLDAFHQRWPILP
jgi:muramoyltetrapeptide carboxypeptidase LdcA involved in peptidoglycan recycling